MLTIYKFLQRTILKHPSSQVGKIRVILIRMRVNRMRLAKEKIKGKKKMALKVIAKGKKQTVTVLMINLRLILS